MQKIKTVKTIKIILSVITIIFIFSGISFADDLQSTYIKNIDEYKPQEIKVSHLFGVSASYLSGIGLSYMYYFNRDYHLMITALPIYYNQEEKTDPYGSGSKAFNKTLFYDYGLQIQRNFAVINKYRTSFEFYNMIGGSYWYYDKKRPFSPEDNKFRKWVTGGIGFGVGFIFSNKFSLNLEASYYYSYWFDFPQRKTGPGVGISVYYAY